MSLFSSYGQLDDNYTRVGDGGFVGMDARTSPDKLSEGVVSYAENMRFRTKEAVTRPANPAISWFYPDNWPYDGEYTNGGGALTGTWTNNGLDAGVTVDSGATSGTPYTQGFEYLRFTSGLILRVTGNESGGVIPVEPQFILNGQSVTGETFVWCRLATGNILDSVRGPRSVISNASQNIMATGRYSNPNGNEYAVAITETSAWFGREHNRPFEVTIPGGVDTEAHLVQAFDRLFLFRGTGQSVLDYTEARGTWAELTPNTNGTYVLPLPNCKRGTFFQNRMWVFVDDSLYFSDIGNPDRYYLLDNEVRINAGTDDVIEALFPFGKYGMLVFLTNSIFLIDNIYGDVATNIRTRQISSRVGCGAPNTIVNVGNQLWFCDQVGDVWSLNQVDEERMELSGEPVSWPIKPLLEEGGAKDPSSWAAAYYDGYYYLFMKFEPGVETRAAFLNETELLSGYTNLNRIGVYDTINQAWASLDFHPTMDYTGTPILTDWLGEQRLMMFAKNAGNLHVIGYGDIEDNDYQSVRSSLITRGLTAGAAVEQLARKLNVSLERFNADYKMYVLTDGELDDLWTYTDTTASLNTVLSSNTNSSNRYTYLVWGKTDYDPASITLYHGDPYRYDYAVFPNDSATGVDFDRTEEGIQLGKFQIVNESQLINRTGNYFQVRIDVNDGRVKIKNVSLDIKRQQDLAGGRV